MRLEKDLERLRQLEARLGELEARAAEVARELAVAGKVAEIARGHNALNMSLQRFVLAARLEEVADAASRRLQQMSRGRFRLRHDTAVARKNQASGLSLVVEDAWTGVTDRPVGALSGGESFLASLALALGLSDVVLRRSGGLRLDALFVDEGFGALDEDTLDDAVRTLEDLRKSGRVVGVISHVAELRRRIPARIEIQRRAEESVAVVRGRGERSGRAARGTTHARRHAHALRSPASSGGPRPAAPPGTSPRRPRRSRLRSGRRAP